ncbi:MAG: hypothetical protein AB6733_00070 [Clostridiaceae bacterium]
MERNQKSITHLGDGDVFIKRTGNGAIKSIKGRLKLEEKKGHLSFIQNKAMITAAGYNHMNTIAAVSIITPEKLTLPDGNIVVNPYPIIDPDSGTIDKVWVKKISIGFSPIGNLVMTSSTLLYDIKMYFIQDLNKKIMNNKNAGRMCMEEMLSEDEKKTGMFLRIQGHMGMWINLQEADVLKCMETYIQNKLFAERKAQTIAERNCLKKHPALAQVYVDAQGGQYNHFGYVDVIGYNHDLTREDLLRLAQMADQGENVEEYKGVKIDYIDANVIDEISEDDLMTARDEEEIGALPEQIVAPMQNIQTITEKDMVTVSRGEDNQEKQAIMGDLEEARCILGDDEFNKTIFDNFRKPLEQLTTGQLSMAKTLINSKIDQGGMY